MFLKDIIHNSDLKSRVRAVKKSSDQAEAVENFCTVLGEQLSINTDLN